MITNPFSCQMTFPIFFQSKTASKLEKVHEQSSHRNGSPRETTGFSSKVAKETGTGSQCSTPTEVITHKETKEYLYCIILKKYNSFCGCFFLAYYLIITVFLGGRGTVTIFVHPVYFWQTIHNSMRVYSRNKCAICL